MQPLIRVWFLLTPGQLSENNPEKIGHESDSDNNDPDE